jgi:hypothetical protein
MVPNLKPKGGRSRRGLRMRTGVWGEPIAFLLIAISE